MRTHPILKAMCLATGAVASTMAVAATPAAESAAKDSGPRGVIHHVVILVQENRTPDNLFHGLPGADIASDGVDAGGNVVRLMPEHLANHYDMGHAHSDFLTAYDGGKLD